MTKLCPRGKAAAKRKFKVYPSAYANAYASKVCAGKIKDPSGVKRKDFKGKKPSSSKVASAAKRVRKANKGGVMKVQKAGLGLMMLMNHMKKEGKKKARAQAREGEMQSLMAGNMPQDKATSGLDSVETTGLSAGGMTPSASGSYIKQDIDGDESFTNPSTQAYYKGMLD
jgi:hypothetical protein